MNLEYLRHGKALCGNVFRRFVETFNFHNDFISNLKGDADIQVVGGKLNVDRTDERHPVIRCNGCGNGGGGESASPLPWTFSCTEDPETGKLKGGWRNKILQVGYSPINLDDDEHDDEDMSTFDDTEHVDGKYYLEIDLKETPKTDRFKIKVVTEPGKDIPYHDIENSIVRVRIGEVTDGKQSGRIIMAPVVYTYIQS